MRKKYAAIFFGVLLILAAVTGWSYYSFFSYRGCINNLLESVPADEKQLPPGIARIFIRSSVLDEYPNVYNQVIFKCRDPREIPYTEYRMHQATWSFLMPRLLNETERLSLYVHFLPFRDGYGLSYGAEHFFSKKIGDLTEEEAIRLILIAGRPTFYDNGNEKDKLDEDVRKFQSRIK